MNSSLNSFYIFRPADCPSVWQHRMILRWQHEKRPYRQRKLWQLQRQLCDRSLARQIRPGIRVRKKVLVIKVVISNLLNYWKHPVTGLSSVHYSGDPKSGRVRISNGRPCPVFEWDPDFEWQPFCPKPFENRTKNVRFSNGFEQDGCHFIINHSKTGLFVRISNGFGQNGSHFVQNHSKTGLFVRFSNGSTIQYPTLKMSGFRMIPVFECPVFGSPLYIEIVVNLELAFNNKKTRQTLSTR